MNLWLDFDDFDVAYYIKYLNNSAPLYPLPGRVSPCSMVCDMGLSKQRAVLLLGIPYCRLAAWWD